MVVFAPNKLIQVVEEIAKQHPLCGVPTTGISENELKDLILRINEKDTEELRSFSRTLSKRQIRSLCTYLPLNTYRVDLNKVAYVVSARLNKDFFELLLRQWEKSPECLILLKILGEHDNTEERPEKCKIRVGLLSQWSHASLPMLALVRSVNDLGAGKTFAERFNSVGLDFRSNLERVSYWSFLERADRNQFTAEGDHVISNSLRQAARDKQVSVLIRLLQFGSADYNFLLDFTELFNIAVSVWDVPNRHSFPNEQLYRTYSWWYNYRQLSQSLRGDYRRIVFWKQYLHLCQCSQRKEHEMLIMRFNNYVVTEFATNGPTYIFRRDYFDDVVTFHMTKDKTGDFKSWLYHFALHDSREVHNSSWERKETAVLRALSII